MLAHVASPFWAASALRVLLPRRRADLLRGSAPSRAQAENASLVFRLPLLAPLSARAKMVYSGVAHSAGKRSLPRMRSSENKQLRAGCLSPAKSSDRPILEVNIGGAPSAPYTLMLPAFRCTTTVLVSASTIQNSTEPESSLPCRASRPWCSTAISLQACAFNHYADRGHNGPVGFDAGFDRTIRPDRSLGQQAHQRDRNSHGNRRRPRRRSCAWCSGKVSSCAATGIPVGGAISAAVARIPD
jgi:hypothetical protein